MSFTPQGRIAPLGRVALVFTLLALGGACTKELAPTSESGPMTVGSAGGGPITDMTEEGCILHPDICHPDDGGGDEDPPQQHPQVGHVEEVGPIDYSLRTPPGLIDPHPDMPGVYLAMSDSACYVWVQQYPQQDSDHDGMTDHCEYTLARAFAPMLVTAEQPSCFGGEPYWAAKYFNNYGFIGTGDFVRIAYMPGYYKDCGTWVGYEAHSGDSEFIQLTVGYNDNSQHWELFNGFLSAHTCVDNSDCASQFSGAPSQTFPHHSELQYPGGRAQTFPRVYVSHGKHANYKSRSACDAGGAFWGAVEACSSHDRGRFMVWESHNIGNARYPLVDCTPSQRIDADPDIEECFWSGATFRGWNDYNYGSPPPGYVYFLHTFAYGCKWLGPGTSWCSSYGI